jgi:hypothetical protein
MVNLKKLYGEACKAYNRGAEHYGICLMVVAYCQRKLAKEAKFVPYGKFAGTPPVMYNVFSLNEAVSRPVRPDLFITDDATFVTAHASLLKILQDPNHTWTKADYLCANQVVYTAIMSVASCYDIWQPKSRKTPGTFFEVFMAGLLQSVFPDAAFSKHISLAKILEKDAVDVGTAAEAAAEEEAEEAAKEEGEDDSSSVSTDVVVGVKGQSGGAVIPLKITTRERIVQPFAHQRILDGAFGAGHYLSLIVCISETQLDKDTNSVNQICVPGTIKLFQKYLAPIGGLYYCDVPQRYAMKDVTQIVKVRSVGHLFEDVRAVLAEVKARAKVG